MAVRVRYLSKLMAALLLYWHCSQPGRQGPAALRNKDSAALSWTAGLLTENGIPFTGRLYQLHPGTHDTASLAQYTDGREDGLWQSWYPDGSLHSRRQFSRGAKTGVYEAWWPGGRLQLQYYFQDDEYEGRCREWNSAGLLVKEMHYHRGHEEGSQKWWYDNGKIKANYVITGGRRYGLLGTKNCINVSDSVFAAP